MSMSDHSKMEARMRRVFEEHVPFNRVLGVKVDFTQAAISVAASEPLDGDCRNRCRNEGCADRRDVEEVSGRNSRERGVADPVSHQAHLALHEEEPDRRRKDPDDRAGREGEPHELGVKDGHGRGRATAAGGRGVGRRR